MTATRPRAEPSDDEAVRLAHRMAKAAGPQKARVMAEACYMLICTAAMATDPEQYFDWLEAKQPMADVTKRGEVA